MMQQKRRRLAHEINVVPYIDVMLVLLVIFMITAPLLTQGVEVDLPDAAAETLDYDSENEPVVLSVDAQGNYYLNRGENPQEPVSDEDIHRIVVNILKHKPDTSVVVEGDEQVPYARVMYAMGLLQGAGVKTLGFATESPE
ncbi:protein TolR [Oceanococcus atlanticus]|uniref:Tol-Pal system protein TolR n=1 Tax=Oceanococcus atlanticus TaxID=1317117 RepID=A0A1Y1SD85_9GAMM|nr:protein TolR [Oceanococcus atlanticus]ORE86275.1 protein TolR [Oceanococcus atlanticus]